jgi:hypothetical protein
MTTRTHRGDGVLRYAPVRPRRSRRCVTCERLIAAGVRCFYIAAHVDGLGFRYGYECERCGSGGAAPSSPSEPPLQV